ncbi:MAG: hypothetical protein EAZ12_05720 [Sphingobacteriia bacterium]|nr:MAG: hypothetical protein EAZ12_05720 [Sphingobacteriia bacterium]
MGISCKTAVDYISKKEEGKLSLFQRFQLWRHLAICYLCKRFEQQNKIIINSLKIHSSNNFVNEPLKTEDKKSIYFIPIL